MTWWLTNTNANGWQSGVRHSCDEPCPTVMQAGLGGDVHDNWHLHDDGRAPMTAAAAKPPFRPLTMGEVRAAPLSGLTHVSTFSGTGGTCLGFRLAGYRTLWANDLEEHARRCYALNLDSPIDGRDIRHVTAADILQATGLEAGQLDVFEGSPPCTAFSTAGKRAKGWRQEKQHAGHVQANVEDLFYEWLRLLEGLRPRAFAAENVAGMVKGVAKGYFKDVLRKMKALGYRSEARLLDAQWLGVPQRRMRVIFVGVREDIGAAPRFPEPLQYRYSVRDALPWLSAAKYDTRGQYTGCEEFVDEPCPAIIGSSNPGRNAGHYLVQDGSRPRRWTDGDEPSPAIMAGRVTNIELSTGRGTRSIDEPSPTILTHGRTDTRSEVAIVEQIVGNDRFEPRFGDLDEPHPTVMRGGARTSGELRVNGERRKFTIEELKRICSFPDDFRLEGSYAAQWARLGNSVPPLMAHAVGAALRDALLEADGHGQDHVACGQA